LNLPAKCSPAPPKVQDLPAKCSGAGADGRNLPAKCFPRGLGELILQKNISGGDSKASLPRPKSSAAVPGCRPAQGKPFPGGCRAKADLPKIGMAAPREGTVLFISYGGCQRKELCDALF
jgi:hypothetical protein